VKATFGIRFCTELMNVRKLLAAAETSSCVSRLQRPFQALDQATGWCARLRDFARIGLMILNGGGANDHHRIVSQQRLDESVRPTGRTVHSCAHGGGQIELLSPRRHATANGNRRIPRGRLRMVTAVTSSRAGSRALSLTTPRNQKFRRTVKRNSRGRPGSPVTSL
jgi:hypothetical protein